MASLHDETNERSDESLVEAVLTGNLDAFGILVRRYEPKLLRYGRRFLSGTEDIEDIVQEVFLKAYQNLRSFDVRRRFSPWIYRIAHNTFVNALRTRARHPVQLMDTDIILPHHAAPSPADDFSAEELRVLTRESLAELNVKYREPLILFYQEGLKYQEIADVLHLPVSTVGVRIARGRKALKIIIARRQPHL